MKVLPVEACLDQDESFRSCGEAYADALSASERWHRTWWDMASFWDAYAHLGKARIWALRVLHQAEQLEPEQVDLIQRLFRTTRSYSPLWWYDINHAGHALAKLSHLPAEPCLATSLQLGSLDVAFSGETEHQALEQMFSQAEGSFKALLANHGVTLSVGGTLEQSRPVSLEEKRRASLLALELGGFGQKLGNPHKAYHYGQIADQLAK